MKKLKWWTHRHAESLFYLLMVLLLLLLALFLSSLGCKVPETTTEYTVQKGDTLWSISEQYCPSSPTRAVVDTVKNMNDLSDYIYPGQVLEIPIETEREICER